MINNRLNLFYNKKYFMKLNLVANILIKKIITKKRVDINILFRF
jgi:hypothetical protein